MTDPVLIKARCHPALEPLLPKPTPAGEALPSWLKDMPSDAPSPTIGGAVVRTLKHCPPFIDALSLGLFIPLACDLEITPGANGPEIAWSWPFPALPDQLLSRGPIGAHVPEQAAGAPLPVGDQLALKFMNFWTLEAPEGWSLLFTHPLNRFDLPFQTLSGVVDCDRFTDGLVHFPAVWTDLGFKGTLKAGTPVAQVIATPRAMALETGVQTETQSAATREVQQALQADRGVYRKRWRAKRS